MTREYRLAPSATVDLDAVSEYFLGCNVEAGEAFFQEFNRKCKNLVNFPNIGRSYSHLGENLRGLPLNGYIVLYEVTETHVTILRVISGRQDLESLDLGIPTR
jgi:toxin ParE1/3/4